MLRQDYIGRLIQQLAEMLARVAGLRKQGQPEQADAELAAAERALGIPIGAERLDARSVATLLGGADKVVLAALILEQRALSCEARGDVALAAKHRARALALLAHSAPTELGAQADELRARLQPPASRPLR
jgi:hypothetical protein